MAKIRIGISGWRYPPWRGVFYPKDLPQHSELHYASRCFPTIELNGSFYSLQTPQSYARWREDTPSDFVFAIKAPRFITHIKRLREIDAPLANFFASGVFELRQKIGPVLWQFPASFHYDHDRFARFFERLPRDTESALKLARRRDHRMKGRVRLSIDRKRRLRHAIEIRHESFLNGDFVALLRQHNIALVVADTAGKWPYVEDVTADFVYLRLHGDEQLYVSGYTDAALARWAARIRAWSSGSQPDDAHLITPAKPKARNARDIYCYFDNDAKVKAPFDAIKLAKKLGLRWDTRDSAAPSPPPSPRRGEGDKREALGG
ncbi:MAG TPA: DUF72 domain-containing protein [Rhodanobacteraceae bacterium]|nr:DUF72 domain-containing protein [Rhodanobacteraceae bacterium]